MATVRTYILAPNFQYKPSGPIQIGNIIADPFRPTKPLSTLPADGPRPPTSTITERDHELSRSKGHAFSAGIWAHFLSSVGGGVSADHGRDSVREFSIDELVTRYLRDEPADDDAELMRRLAEPRVRAAVKAGLFGRQPVYLISGVKIARGLSVRSELRRTVGGGVGVTVPVTAGVSVGGEVKGERRDGIASSFRAVEDVVFAYQVHVVRVKGRRMDAAVVDVFESDAAFLHGEEEGGEGHEGVAVSVGLAGVEDLREGEDEDSNVVIDSCEFVDADGVSCLCITAKGG
ncbi:hypothetical protein QBC33DRAFT_462612 [Phialemonium atrogriseum]|uniref:Uncharacterized protein n=1 Tax=Phialemonium atrogriseum TaxID=1093897 RepID=A0AAJ0BRK8_9PEZI|nr:uncharacterized protein QBC33DRAFT_462612 [Phialemonium atrogriseum]KAK1761839.1 hypothetical protein QBC33DRAFT_462612 [Phialemonium atrogriseum]